jgi:hypothetical protein
VGRVSKDGCAIVLEGLILVVVPADTDVPVVMVSDPIVLTTFCDVT